MDDATLPQRQQTESAFALAQIVSQITDELLDNPKLDDDEILTRNPDFAAQLRELLPALRGIAALPAASSSSPSELARNVVLPQDHSKTLGDFCILHELGRGGMGTVFEAEQISMGRRVALKVLPFAALAQDKALQRFRNEVRAAAALDHPHIVKVYSVGEERGIHYYAMQLVRGQSLAEVIGADRIRLGIGVPKSEFETGNDATASGAVAFLGSDSTLVAQARLSTVVEARRDTPRYRTAARLGVQAAEALQHAHDQGVLHRDIKPGNLLLDREGQLYIADFGLARIEADAGMTMTGDMVGTLRYMAPEQALAKRVVIDHRADVYSLGATLYELLTLQPAFGATDRSELLRQIAFDEPQSIRKRDRHIPVELETIVRKAMAKCPDERYGTAQDLAHDLQRQLNDEPIHARPPTVLDHAVKWSRRHIGVVSTGLLATTLIAILALVSATLLGQKYREADTERKRANGQMNAAQEALAAETQARREATQNLYRAHIREAQEALQRGNVSRAESLLYEYMPQGNEADYRDWEWYFLVGKLDGGSEIIDQHSSVVSAVRFSPNGKLFVAVSARHVQLWNSAPRKLIREIQIPYGRLLSASFSPDGNTVAITSDDCSLRLWGVGQLGALRKLNATRVEAARSSWNRPVWNSDGTKLATVSYDRVVIWDVQRGIEIQTIPFVGGRLYTAAWRPAGNELAVSREGFLHFVDANTGKERLRIEPHGHDLWTIDWRSDGSQLATGSFDQQVKIVDAETGAVLHELAQPAGVNEVRFSPDGSRLACATTGQEIRLWNTENWQIEAVLAGHRDRVLTLDWHPDGKQLLSGGGNIVRMWHTGDPHPSIGSDTPARAFHLDRRLAALVTDDDTLQVYDYGNRAVLYSTPGKRVSWNATGDRLAVQLDDTVRVLESTTGEQINAFTVPEKHQLEAGWSGDEVAILSRNGNELRAWEVATGEEVARINVSAFVQANWSPRERLLSVLSSEGVIEIWDMSRPLRLSQFQDSQLHSNFTNIAWSPDGHRIATAGWGGDVKLWEARSGRLLHDLVGHVRNQFIRTVTWSSDGDLIASGGWDQSIKIWDTHRGRLIHSLDGHNTSIRSLAFHPTSKRLVSSDWHGSGKLWDVSSGEEIVTLDEGGGNKKALLCWSNDGGSLWGRSFWKSDGDGVYSLFEGRARIFDAKQGYKMARSGELDAAVANWVFAEGIRLARADNVAESDRAFETAERLVGAQSWARRGRANLFRLKGLEARAVEDLRIASETVVEQPEAKNELAVLLANRDDDQVRKPQQAEKLARELLADWPKQCEFWMTLALAQYRQGKWKDALDSLDRAEQYAWHQQPGIDVVRAITLFRLARVKEAKHSLETSAKIWGLFKYFMNNQGYYHNGGGPMTPEAAERLHQEADTLINGSH